MFAIYGRITLLLSLSIKKIEKFPYCLLALDGWPRVAWGKECEMVEGAVRRWDDARWYINVVDMIGYALW